MDQTKKLTQLLVILSVMSLLAGSALALDAKTISFNGSELYRNSGTPTVAFRSLSDPDFIESVTMRRMVAESTFSAAVRAFVTRAKSDSHGAQLKMLERPNSDDIIIVYLADLTSSKVIYKAERLLKTPGDKELLSISYAAEFEPGSITDEQEVKIKRSAIDTLAKFDPAIARTTLQGTE